MHPDGHDDLLERRVARPLAQAVDGALDLTGPVLDAGERQCRRHAKVVVGVNRDGDVLDATDVVGKPLDARAKVLGHLIAGGIGDVDDGGAGLDGRLDHALKEALVRAARVLGIELDVLHVALRVAHAVDGPLYTLVLAYHELIAQVLRRDA